MSSKEKNLRRKGKVLSKAQDFEIPEGNLSKTNEVMDGLKIQTCKWGRSRSIEMLSQGDKDIATAKQKCTSTPKGQLKQFKKQNKDTRVVLNKRKEGDNNNLGDQGASNENGKKQPEYFDQDVSMDGLDIVELAVDAKQDDFSSDEEDGELRELPYEERVLSLDPEPGTSGVTSQMDQSSSYLEEKIDSEVNFQNKKAIAYE